MIGNDECWAVILARSGSKGLPGKNIREFAGKPLMAWSIEHAQKSKCVDRVIVSSDSHEYLAIARSFGAATCLRGKHAATSEATNFDVLRELVDEHTWNTADGEVCATWLAVLQPTNPMRADGTIDDLASMTGKPERDPDMVFTARTIGTEPWIAWHLDSHRSCYPIAAGSPEETWAAPRQQRPACFTANGNGWLMRAMYARNPTSTAAVVPIIEPSDMYQDIDTLDDFNRIEKLFLARKGLTDEPARAPLYAHSGAYPD